MIGIAELRPCRIDVTKLEQRVYAGPYTEDKKKELKSSLEAIPRSPLANRSELLERTPYFLISLGADVRIVQLAEAARDVQGTSAFSRTMRELLDNPYWSN